MQVSTLPGPVLAVAVGLAGCVREDETSQVAANETPVVCAVSYPIAYFAARIAGDGIEVVFDAPADVDPARWRPGDATIERYQSADLVLLNGAGYAAWTRYATLRPSRLVDTAEHLGDELIPIGAGVTHAHGPEGEHTHGGWAFTTWLDPHLAAGHAEAIAAAFAHRWPERRIDFETNLRALLADLDALDAALEAATAGRSSRPLLFSHPVYQYLARRCDFNAASVHFEPDTMPSATQWDMLDALLDQHPARLMIWEATPDPEIEVRLARRGVASAVFSPCAVRPPKGDYLDAMRANVERLAVAFEE